MVIKFTNKKNTARKKWEKIFDRVRFFFLFSLYFPSVFLYLVLDYLTIFCQIINKPSGRRKKGCKNESVKFWWRSKILPKLNTKLFTVSPMASAKSLLPVDEGNKKNFHGKNFFYRRIFLSLNTIRNNWEFTTNLRGGYLFTIYFFKQIIPIYFSLKHFILMWTSILFFLYT